MPTTIKISDKQANQIDKLVGFHGFTSRTDFVRKAIEKQVAEYQEGEI